MKATLEHEMILSGAAISEGIALGAPYFFKLTDVDIPEEKISAAAVKHEIIRYREALKQSHYDLSILLSRMERENAIEAATILDAHLHIMQDPLLTTDVEEVIQKQLISASYAFQTLVHKYVAKFQSMTDHFFRERVRDLQDIARRIMSHLCESKQRTLTDIPEGSIVFAHDLTASVIAEVKKGFIAAIVTQSGGITSHAAIIAKAKEIPYVANVNYGSLEKKIGNIVVIDGGKGVVILNPTKQTEQDFKKRKREQQAYLKQLESLGPLKAETLDGHKMLVSANIEMAAEVGKLHKYGGSGVGLFRSECLFLSRPELPAEEEQFRIYKRIVERMKGLPLVIRTFDVGGDKLTHGLQAKTPTGNPYLGCRAIRFLLKEQDIFRTQLRAILRASAFGNVRILFPMITSLPELQQAKELMAIVKKDLISEKKKVAPKIPVGCMVEVPAAAITADLFAKECDFLSIGTNDLVQYSLAADRSNQEVSALYSPAHPSVIRLIQLVLSLAKRCDTPVTVCGEMAADPKFTPLLMGLGVEELSVATRWIAMVKNVVRHFSLAQAKELAKQVLSLSTAEEIEDLLEKTYRKTIPSEFFPPD